MGWVIELSNVQLIVIGKKFVATAIVVFLI